MSFVPANPAFEARTRASFAKQGAMAHLGAVLDRVEVALEDFFEQLWIIDRASKKLSIVEHPRDISRPPPQ